MAVLPGKATGVGQGGRVKGVAPKSSWGRDEKITRVGAQKLNLLVQLGMGQC